jgi:hypothetical protein
MYKVMLILWIADHFLNENTVLLLLEKLGLRTCENIQFFLKYTISRTERSSFSRKFLQNIASLSLWSRYFEEQIHILTNITGIRLYFLMLSFDPDKSCRIIFLYFAYFRPFPKLKYVFWQRWHATDFPINLFHT